jgi:hypothetical protein
MFTCWKIQDTTGGGEEISLIPLLEYFRNIWRKSEVFMEGRDDRFAVIDPWEP